MAVPTLLGLIFVALLCIVRQLDLIRGAIGVEGKETREKLEGILVQTDYASMYLQKITEMMEMAEGTRQAGGAT